MGVPGQSQLPGVAPYSATIAIGVPGQLANLDSGKFLRAFRNDDTGGDIPFGVVLAHGSTSDDQSAILPTSAAAKLAGIGVFELHTPDGLTTASIAKGDYLDVADRGEVYVAVEQAVNVGDPAYFRFAASVNTPALTQKGALRKNPDGVLPVKTVTPTAVNATIYLMRVGIPTPLGAVKEFFVEFISSGAATATNICTGLKAAIAADPELAALVTPTGTATLILTGVTAGQPIYVAQAGDGVLTVADTTPAAPTAAVIPGANFKTAAAAGGIAVLQMDVAASRVAQI